MLGAWENDYQLMLVGGELNSIQFSAPDEGGGTLEYTVTGVLRGRKGTAGAAQAGGAGVYLVRGLQSADEDQLIAEREMGSGTTVPGQDPAGEPGLGGRAAAVERHAGHFCTEVARGLPP